MNKSSYVNTQIYISMELAEMDLERKITDKESILLKSKFFILAQISHTLKFLHSSVCLFFNIQFKII